MNPGTEYIILKRGSGDLESVFVSIKLSTTMRSALEESAHSSVEFTSQEEGLIHIGSQSFRFSIQNDAKMELYNICPDDIPFTSTAPALTFVGPVSGRVILHRDQEALTAKETAHIRLKTELVEEEAKRRRVMTLPGGPAIIGKQIKSALQMVPPRLPLPTQSSRKRARAIDEAPKSLASENRTPSLKLQHSEVVLRGVPALFSMRDLSRFLSGIQLRSGAGGSAFFVVFLLDEGAAEQQHGHARELFMDVFVELESVAGVEIALKRNNEECTSSNSSSSSSSSSSSTHEHMAPICLEGYCATRRNYCARIEAARNGEVFCAKNIGFKITATDNGLRLPAVAVLRRFLDIDAALLSSLQMPPTLLLRHFPRFFSMLEARLKGDRSKRPGQWTAYFDDSRSSYVTLQDHLDLVFVFVLEQSKRRSGHAAEAGEGSLVDDLVVIVSNLVHMWSGLVSRNLSAADAHQQDSQSSTSSGSSAEVSGDGSDSRVPAAIELVGRQIQFYHILYNSELFKKI